MSYTVTLPDQTVFTVDENETVLAAAERNNLNLPHSCKSGFCGQCKAEVLQGKVEMGEHSGKTLSEEEQVQGKVLLCCTYPKSDLSVAVKDYQGADAIPVRTLPARVEKLDIVGDAVLLTLTLPKTAHFQFRAGQYIDLLLPGNASRSYSLASSSADTESLQLHIRRRDNGLFSNMIFSETPSVKEKSIVRIKGPLGSFTLKSEDKPLIMLATGTGFAPIRAMLLDLIARQSKQAVHVYWGVRKFDDFYALEDAKELVCRLKNGKFTAVLSQPDAEWQGETGYVQQAAARDYPDMAGVEVYACGAVQMAEGARVLLTETCALPEDAFYSDVFTPSV